jgi:hypothetical protein
VSGVMDALCTEQLSELVERKLHLLRSLMDLSLAQHDLVSTSQIDALLTLLGRKNRAMEALQTVQRDLLPYQDQAAEARVWRSQLARENCRRNLIDCERLMSELIAIESHDVETLSEERELVGKQLQSIHSVSSVNRAYEANSTDEEEVTAGFSIEG